MGGTRAGGLAAAALNKKKYGKDFYTKIGAKGGKNGHTGGFAAGEEGRERARVYGAVGWRISKRGPAKKDPLTPVLPTRSFMYRISTLIGRK